MKKRTILLTILCICLICVIALCGCDSSSQKSATKTTSSSKSSSQSNSSSVKKGSLASLKKKAKIICPDVIVRKSNDHINYDFSNCNDIMSNDGLEFMWHAARLLPLNSYESIGFSAVNDDIRVTIQIIDYKGLGSFTSTLPIYEGVASNWQSAYDLVFGAHDISYQNEKADGNETENKTDELLWFYATFDEGSKYNFENSNYTYAEIYGYNNTETDGKIVGRIARRAVDNYDEIKQYDESLFPKKIIAIGVDNVTGLILTDKGDSWGFDYTDNAANFLKGYKETIND